MSQTVQETTSAVPRRRFLKWSAAAGGTTALVGAGAYFGVLPGIGAANAATATSGLDVDKTVWSSCNVNCGSRCPLRMQVKDGQIVRVLPDNTGDDEIGTQQIRACVRGRSVRHRIYNPDRLKTPMRRKPGTKRGGGEWEEITWEEAFDTVAGELKRILDEYGNEAVYINYGTGTLGGTIACSWPPNQSPVARLMNCLGGYLNHYNTYSSAQITSATPYTYGTNASTNSNDDWANARLVVMFGYNPLEVRMSGGGETFVAQKVKKDSNVRMIVIDPRYTDTALDLADEWIPIRPGTDAALVAGIAHVMISEGLQDQAFLDSYCVGFDDEHLPEGIPAGSSYKSYIMGAGPDGVEKTPEWAATITGIPAQTIVRLAREIGAGPVAINQGLGPQRHASGENTVRAAHVLACMTGSVGISGGGTGGHSGSYSLPMANPWVKQNPVETAISVFMWTDAIDHGPDMTATKDGIRGKDKLDVPLKFMWNYGGNALINQHSDHNRTAALLQDESKCELIVVIDNVMTSSARFADILLPDVTSAEQLDIIKQGQSGTLGYTIVADQVIDPLYDCKTTFEMMSEIAERLGVLDAFTEGRTQEGWVRHVVDESRKEIPELPSFDELRESGIWKTTGTTKIALKDFREDPETNPLETPSGKIEIFSEKLWDLANEWELTDGDKITAVPEYVPTWEGAEEAKTNRKYPLQMIGHHYKQRTHSSYGNVDWMLEAHPQVVWVNPIDAGDRGIGNDDLVEVFNDRGRVRIPARVTPRIAPGVISIPQGSWYTPDKDGVDTGGSVNTLTTWRPSALAKGNPQHTNLVNVEKA
ncbi:dimethyl sulfoxide reductase subunit A [Georgenia yuyongxinii]|uniref:Dimethyl sulfoxide reductase subunit A n=1 Tax=Georgenia yuyongxinii TaxID=2589797 RepID=A0A5B8C821_9MICO|nr:DMSO/selenate family reductase complex A subunit [Georgenia yuyongxinii]QDC25505.1 dimethyl sulfoxide reductase subunit A [Georgenia yuyongxinii]